MRNSENSWTIEEAGMAQLDDVVGTVMQKLKDLGVGASVNEKPAKLKRHGCGSTTIASRCFSSCFPR
jgi:hypothetical protein